MAIVINADSRTVLILDRDDRIDPDTLSLLTSKATARPAPAPATPTPTAPRDEAAAMRQVEAEVY